MQRTALDFLVCPACEATLDLKVFQQEAEEVLEGSLRCCACARTFSIRLGVPRMLLDPQVDARQRETAKAFGWQWKRFSNLLGFEQQREQFLDWVTPLGPEDFHRRVVLDLGCGMGRLSEVVAGFSPRALIAVDLSEAVDVAWQRLRGRRNVHVVQADAYALPLRRGVEAQLDLSYSVGVLHHLPSPFHGFEAMIDHIRTGGRAHVWVYGAEGNAWVRDVVTPIRRQITSRLPRPALLGLSWLLTVPLHGVAVAEDRYVLNLPYASYLSWLGRYPLRHTLHVVFDHLGPPTSHYLPREELERWTQRDGLRLLALTRRNQNSWRMLVEKTGPVSPTPRRERPRITG